VTGGAATGFLAGPRPAAFAHRGFATDGTENSLAAFQRAVDLGYAYLETDVRTTADGVALAFHDPWLDRVTDWRGTVAELPWSTVRRARIAGREPIPRLDDVLAAWPDVRVNLDVKADRGIRPTIEAIRRTGSLDRVCLSAFSDGRVRQLRRALGPALCTGLGPREAARLTLAALAGRPALAGELGGRCAQLPHGRLLFRAVDSGLVSTAHALGLAVHIWTVNAPADMIRLLELGVDGIMTDRADVLRDVLRARGQWPAD
jgi:glycerophosphoryl diester phosphodiesterase